MAAQEDVAARKLIELVMLVGKTEELILNFYWNLRTSTSVFYLITAIFSLSVMRAELGANK